MTDTTDLNTINHIILPRMMEIGKEAYRKLPKILSKLKVTKPLIITDGHMINLGYISQISDVLTQNGLYADVFSDTIPEPTDISIQSGVKIASQGYDCLIALGGGSVIDSAKAISILTKFGGEIENYRFPNQIDEQGLPIIAIPTTAGTGSEVTKFTIITNESKHEKLLCLGDGFMPIAAIIDYTFTMSMPPRITADTGIDAMTHAIEAYVSKKANLYSDQQALSALRLIGKHLKNAYRYGDESSRAAMMLGSTLAGMAFNNSSVALVHGMSRPLGAFFHVPHGLSNAMLLPTVTEFSIPSAAARYADCARALGIVNGQDSDKFANEQLISFLRKLNQELSVPSLAEFGVCKIHFDELKDTLCQQAFASGSPNNNPRIPTQDDMMALYDSLWQ